MAREPWTYLDRILAAIDRILACGEGLVEGELNWRPAGDRTNSVFAIARHAVSNAERNVLGTYCGQAYEWRRELEFAATGESLMPLLERWRALKESMQDAVEVAGHAGLTRTCVHPRLGPIEGREVLLQAAYHAAEHVGEAQLTRALLEARRG